MACPKCSTRVMVPGDVAAAASTPFEDRAVERSLDALQHHPGGIFAGESFELPQAGQDVAPPNSDEDQVVASIGLLVPWWALYAGLVLVAGTAVGSFLVGAWWAGHDRGIGLP